MSRRVGGLPPIASDGFYVPKSSGRTNKPAQLDDGQSSYLPRIPSAKGASARSVNRENTLVVGTSNLDENGPAPLPEEWTQMRVNPPQEDDSHRTKLEWENQIAKHILSLFATTHAVKNVSEGNALLDFVDVDKSHVKSPDKKTTNTVDLLHTRPPPRQSALFEADATEAEEEGNSDGAPASAADHTGTGNPTRKKKKVKRTKKGKLSAAEDGKSSTRRSTSSLPQGISESDYAIAERVLLRVHAEAEREALARGPAKAREKDKYRITNTIRLKDGRELVVRGAPRCYPIWFVSTGDVFADWTALPGGAKLQAHLNVLYEQQKYSDYLGVLETLITELWRKAKFGAEVFTLGSFGHSANMSAGHSGTNTGANSGYNTGSNTARSRRGSHSGPLSGTMRPRKHSSPGRGEGAEGSPQRSNGAMAQGWPGSAGDEDSQFGAAVVWEDAGEEGFIPKKVPSAHSPVLKGRARAGESGPLRDPAKAGRERGFSGDDMRGDRSTTAGGTLNGLAENSHDDFPEHILPPETLSALWRQLVLAAIAMGVLYLEKKVPDQAMLLFKRAEEWAANDELVPQRFARKELKAHVRDAISYYFFKRKKSIAALGYSEQAMALYEETDNLDGIAVCLLHVAAVHSQIGDFKEAHKKLFQFLAMVESGRLATADATPKQLCLVAIGYHNLAVVQLKLAMPDLACKNSQNARKIARLCLSYSNRWIDIFQYTHEIAIADIKYELSSKKAGELSPAQLALVIELSEALFDPYSDVNQDQDQDQDTR